MKTLTTAGLQTLTTAELFSAREFLEEKIYHIEVALANSLAPASMENHMRTTLETLECNITTISSVLEAR